MGLGLEKYWLVSRNGLGRWRFPDEAVPWWRSDHRLEFCLVDTVNCLTSRARTLRRAHKGQFVLSVCGPLTPPAGVQIPDQKREPDLEFCTGGSVFWIQLESCIWHFLCDR